MKKKKMDRYFKAAVLGCLIAITIHERVYGWALVYMFLLSHMDKVLQEVGEEHKNILICHPWKKGKHSKEGKRGGENMEEQKVFVPHDLKTIEIDIEKKIFRVNGEDFGNSSIELDIRCSANGDPSDYLKVVMETESRIVFANYDIDGRKTKEEHNKKG